MDKKERKVIIDAISKAIEAYEEFLNKNDCPAELYPIKIEVQEIREGDYSFSERVVVDRINEWEVNRKLKLGEVDNGH